MWISRQEYDDIRDSRIKHEMEVQEVRRHNISLQATMDWMTMRLTQLEHERAKLIETYMGVKIAVPHIEPSRDSTPVETLLNDAGSLFKDVGDVEAKRLGLDWDDEGHLLANGR